MKSKNPKLKDCIICFEKIKKKNLVVLECAHMFHTNCIITMVKKRNRKCPLCRKRITWNVPQLKKHIDLYKK